MKPKHSAVPVILATAAGIFVGVWANSAIAAAATYFALASIIYALQELGNKLKP